MQRDDNEDDGASHLDIASRRTNRFEGTTHLSTTWRLAAATQDDSRNPMGLNKLRDTAEAAKAQAGHAVPVLLGQVHS